MLSHWESALEELSHDTIFSISNYPGSNYKVFMQVNIFNVYLQFTCGNRGTAGHQPMVVPITASTLGSAPLSPPVAPYNNIVHR